MFTVHLLRRSFCAGLTLLTLHGLRPAEVERGGTPNFLRENLKNRGGKTEKVMRTEGDKKRLQNKWVQAVEHGQREHLSRSVYYSGRKRRFKMNRKGVADRGDKPTQGLVECKSMRVGGLFASSTATVLMLVG